MFLKMWREECTKSAFGFRYDYPERFTRCHWQNADRVLPTWVVYRAIMAAYAVCSLIYTWTPIDGPIPKEKRVKYMIFLTHWTYLLEVLVFLWGLGIVFARAWKESNSCPPYEPYKKMPVTYIIYWIMYTIALSGSVVVTVIFWGGVYDPIQSEMMLIAGMVSETSQSSLENLTRCKNPKYNPVSPTNLIEHAFNSLIMVVDFLLVAHPIRFLHFYLGPLFGIAYSLFTLIYYLCGGTGVMGFVPIYKIVDWRKPQFATLTCVFAIAFLILLHSIFFLVTKFKFWAKDTRNSQGEIE